MRNRTNQVGNEFEELRSANLQADDFIRLALAGAKENPTAYLSRAELEHQAYPSQLTLREWWLALKIQRLAGRREIALADRDGRPFSLASGDFFAALLHDLDRDVAGTGEGPEILTHRNTRDYFAARASAEEAMASCRLDGLVFEPAVGEELLRTSRRPADDAERTLLNTQRGLGFVRQSRALPLTLALLSDLHQRLTSETLPRPDAGGRLRRADEPVTLEPGPERHEPPPAASLPARLKALLALANGRAPSYFIHPLVRAAVVQFWVLHDQPFPAANGRLARALFLWVVLRAGYPIFDYLAPSRALAAAPGAWARAFGQVLADDNDLNYFVAHQLAAVERARRHFRDEARRHAGATRAAAELLSAQPDLNHRQHALVAQALAEPGRRHTLRAHARAHGLSRQSARNDFTALVRAGLFEETKAGKTLAFFPVPELRAKLGLDAKVEPGAAGDAGAGAG